MLASSGIEADTKGKERSTQTEAIEVEKWMFSPSSVIGHEKMRNCSSPVGLIAL
jgi:hypothetical protein